MEREHVEIDLGSSEANSDFIKKAERNLTRQLANLQWGEIGSNKSHHRRRPKREIRDIGENQSHRIHQIENALKILRGEQEGTIKFIKDIQTGKVLGFRITSEK